MTVLAHLTCKESVGVREKRGNERMHGHCPERNTKIEDRESVRAYIHFPLCGRDKQTYMYSCKG